MSRHIKRTTIRLDEALLDQARREARARGKTMTSLVEEGLRSVLARSKPVQRQPRVELPVFRSSGGLMPGVDLSDNAALLDLLDAGLPLEKRR